MSPEQQNNPPDVRAILAEIAQALQAEALARIQERHDWTERMERIEKNVEAITANVEAIGAKMELLTADVQTLATNAMSHTDRLNKLEGL